MKTSFFLSLASLTCAAMFAANSADGARILAISPLRFEPGPGVHSNEFMARGLRSQFVFEGSGARVQAGGKTLSFEFAGPDHQARLEGTEKLNSTTGIFIGNDPSKWRRAIPNFGRLEVRGLYRGIDLVYYGNAGELEYDLVVKRGADPRQIRLAFHGATPSLDRNGNLDVGFTLKQPIAYQIAADGKKTQVDSRFRKNADGTYGFILGRYDRGRDLVIDPVLTLSQYIGGSAQDIGYAIGHDGNGFIYIGGTTYSSDFPTAGSAAGNTPPGGEDLFLAKIDPRTGQVVYAGFFGGSGNDSFGGMAVDSRGYVYLTGTTGSSNFPNANGAKTTLSGATDAFVMQLDLFETPIYSTYLGGTGNEIGTGITLDSRGRIWVTGGTQSTDFPTTNGFQTASGGSQDAFVAGIDPTQSGSGSLIYSTYLGGMWWDTGRGIAAAPDGTLWVVGGTYSYNFPVAGASINPGYSAGGDAFISQINPGSGLTYSTFLGGNDLEEARSVVVDAQGRVMVSGYTLSVNFPVTADALQSQNGGNADVFVSILNSPNSSTNPGQLVYSTYFGGSNADVPFDLKVDPSGNLYVAGFTESAKLPASANALQGAYDNTMDAFALKLNPSKPGPAGISYFSYLGSDGLQIAYGIDFDANNNIYLTGFTSGPIFDALGGVGKGTSAGNPDAFVIGFSTQQ
ncbi:MAG TPA: SBBP repeat-containing protein [Bryobacteraceae bacterium]|nr:SBBP repeat-containing protein [Bryobacteraceae bacterium]